MSVGNDMEYGHACGRYGSDMYSVFPEATANHPVGVSTMAVAPAPVFGGRLQPRLFSAVDDEEMVCVFA